MSQEHQDSFIQLEELTLIQPGWPAPARVKAYATTRKQGKSEGNYLGLNLGDHVADDPAAVAHNRQRLQQVLGLELPPTWLNQVHGTHVLPLPAQGKDNTADAASTQQAGVPCAVMTADCLPVLFCDRQGSFVAAAHAGWRGLLDGVLEQSIRAFPGEAGELMAWLGPAISQPSFEVGSEVRKAFIEHDDQARDAFLPGKGAGKWQADLYMLARQRLAEAGVQSVYGGHYCTLLDPDTFYSYRRDHQTGRQASLIWIQP